eukprot:gb/GECG01007422.1/.p1 GENE.gb/GECG01007422.1/~~gb/GECG01007422.1/.p1  ORF type:complete len:114 (+),score=4.38 gb/GECG01007422.1/:1-342(+)
MLYNVLRTAVQLYKSRDKFDKLQYYPIIAVCLAGVSTARIFARIQGGSSQGSLEQGVTGLEASELLQRIAHTPSREPLGAKNCGSVFVPTTALSARPSQDPMRNLRPSLNTGY